MMYDWGYGGYHWFGMILGPVLLLAFIAAAAFVVAWVFQAVGLGTSVRGRSGSALDVLKERLAKGEINSQEFEERRKLIEGS